MSKMFLFRLGDGNEGNYPQFCVELEEADDAYDAIVALVVNRYIEGRPTREHILDTIEVDGEAEYGVDAMVLEGPKGETAFGNAWLTATLVPADDHDLKRYSLAGPLERILDAKALADFNSAKEARKAKT